MLLRLDSSKANPLIVAKWMKSRFFKYLTLLSNAAASILGDNAFFCFSRYQYIQILWYLKYQTF